MITVSLYGGLEEWFGEELFLDVQTPQEVFWALASQCDAFLDHIRHVAAAGNGYEVIVDNQSIDEQQLDFPILGSISIVPVIAGAGDVGRIILGSILLIGSFFLPAVVLGISSFAVGALGANLLIGGITNLLTAKPKKEDTGNQSSSILDASGLPRTAQGDSIPVLFGLDWWITDPPIVGSWASNNEVAVNWVPT